MSYRAKKWMWSQILTLLARDGNHCPDCNVKMIFDLETREMTSKGMSLPDNALTIDHIIPLSKGGDNTLSNFRLTCKKCNLRRGVKPIKPATTYRPSQEIWDLLKKQNTEHQKSPYVTTSGFQVFLRYRTKLRITCG